MKQLINYKLTKNKVEEYVEVELLIDREVLVDISICLIDFGKVYDKAYVVYGTKDVAVALSQQELDKLLETTKIFKFKIKDSQVIETKGTPDIEVRLPKDTKVDELIYENGQLLWAKPLNKEE